MGKNKIILIIIGILILGGFVFYFNYWQKQIQQKAEVDQCKNYPKVEGEISCQKAKEIALMEYPGEVKYIEKKKAEIPLGILPDVEMAEEEVWLVGINLEEPIEIEGDETEYQSIEVFILRDSGEIQINSLFSGEI